MGGADASFSNAQALRIVHQNVSLVTFAVIFENFRSISGGYGTDVLLIL